MVENVKKPWIFHPFLFAVYPPLAYYFSNTSQVKIETIFVSLTITLLFTILCWWLLIHFQVGKDKTPILISAFLFIFFSFQHLLYGIKLLVVITGISESVKFWLDTWMGMFSILIFMVLIFTLLCFWVWTTKRRMSTINTYLNIVAGVLISTSIVFPLVGRVNLNKNISNIPADFNDYWKIRSQSDLQTLEPVQFPLPDIYYIILDGYGSGIILQDVYQFDNSDFEQNLESMGFYINRQAHSNYKQTNLSITSSLNFMYLQDVGPELNSPNGGISTLGTMYENNRVFGQLRQQGYQVVAFSNGYEQTDLKRTADIYLSGAKSPSSYETGLINTTPLTLFLWRDAYDWHRGKVLFTLSTLPETVTLKSPKIVFAHILIPHPPFVLSSEGKAIYPNRPFNIYDGSDFMGVGSPREYIEGYREQVEFINTSITGIISANS